jgi:hypothetical protein
MDELDWVVIDLEDSPDLLQPEIETLSVRLIEIIRVFSRVARRSTAHLCDRDQITLSIKAGILPMSLQSSFDSLSNRI